MPLAEHALEYWQQSQHIERLPNDQLREQYTTLVLVPVRDSAPEQDRRRLLGRLIDRCL